MQIPYLHLRRAGNCSDNTTTLIHVLYSVISSRASVENIMHAQLKQ